MTVGTMQDRLCFSALVRICSGDEREEADSFNVGAASRRDRLSESSRKTAPPCRLNFRYENGRSAVGFLQPTNSR